MYFCCACTLLASAASKRQAADTGNLTVHVGQYCSWRITMLLHFERKTSVHDDEKGRKARSDENH